MSCAARAGSSGRASQCAARRSALARLPPAAPRPLHRRRSASPDHNGRIGRPVAALVGRHELLDLAEVLADRLAAPFCLGRRNRDARELAQRRERQGARGERSGEHRQLRERARDAQPLQRNPRRVAECALEVVEHRDHAERPPDAGDLCLAQPAHLLGVESSAALRDAAQCEIDSLDVSIARHDVVLARDISGLRRAT